MNKQRRFGLSNQAGKHNRRLLFYLIVIGLLLYAVVPKYGQLTAGIRAIGQARPVWLILALLAISLTHMAGALTYVILAKHRLKYWLTVAIQVAASFTNRLLPSGLGGISLYVYYLIKKGHSPPEATSVTVMNSLVSVCAHFILLLAALTIGQASLATVFKGRTLPPALTALLVILIALSVIVLARRQSLRRRLVSFVKNTWHDILDYRHQPAKLLLAIISAGSITVFYVLAFYACAHAMGLPLGLAQAFLIYSLGILLGAAALTPGGLGGLEAGLVAGLVAFGYSTATAFAVVIIYRLITFWLPIIPGYLAFWQLRRHKTV